MSSYTNYATWIDAHYADGKIGWVKDALPHQVEYMFTRIEDSTPIAKMSLKRQVSEALHGHLSPCGMQSLKTIQTGNGNQVGGYDAHTILVYLTLFSEMDKDLIAEQLHDMTLTHGLCPAGRVNRLLQLLIAVNL